MGTSYNLIVPYIQEIELKRTCFPFSFLSWQLFSPFYIRYYMPSNIASSISMKIVILTCFRPLQVLYPPTPKKEVRGGGMILASNPNSSPTNQFSWLHQQMEGQFAALHLIVFKTKQGSSQNQDYQVTKHPLAPNLPSLLTKVG